MTAVAPGKTVADPCVAYLNMQPSWERSRAICNGTSHVRDYDTIIDTLSFSNLLIPFSPTMTQDQYEFFKAEAELPGIVAQYSRIIVGGILRKKPQVKLPDDAPEEALQWILDNFAQDDSTLLTFLDDAIWEEVQTSRAWVYIDHPVIPDDVDPEDKEKIKPYPVLWTAESIINWRVGINPITGADRKSVV